MRRGELWRYQVPGFTRTVVLIAAQAVLDRTEYKTFPALQISDTDPGHLLYVTAEIDANTVWIDVAGGWLTVRRSLLAQPLGQLPDDTLTALDARIAAALGHPN
ncbi:hypothetical protein [Nocardia vaccinii]|uniref:hypothetical protein n=1 Tax=Nocardia vaccinii TaxID=1822 RepID=UPI0008364F0A|nr:hypothetical protein [Nocardia vaccinii]